MTVDLNEKRVSLIFLMASLPKPRTFSEKFHRTRETTRDVSDKLAFCPTNEAEEWGEVSATDRLLVLEWAAESQSVSESQLELVLASESVSLRQQVPEPKPSSANRF